MTIRPVQNHGNLRFRVDFGKGADGNRHVEFFDTEAKAKAAFNKAAKDTEAVGKRWANLPAEDRLAVVKTLDEMREAGVSLAQVWQAYRIERMCPVGSAHRRSLRQSIDELLTAKRNANLRRSYLRGLEQYLRLFARGREEMPVDRITVADIDSWFCGRAESLATKASNLGRLSSLFDLCWRRKYCLENVCKRVELARLEPRPPSILKMRLIAKSLVWTRRKNPSCLGWLSLALLVGLRPEEADKTGWSNIDLERGMVRVDASASKVRQRRIVVLTPAALHWLKVARQSGSVLPIAKSTRRRFIRKLRRVLGYQAWPQDILRHTAASYLLAYHQDAAKVARELGNSASVLLRHYTELVSKEDGERFVSLVGNRQKLARQNMSTTITARP